MESVEARRTTTELDPELWLDEHGEMLYSFALFRVRNPVVAEDLVQDTLLTALTARKRFLGNSSERTWLIGILKHKILDYVRQSAKLSLISTQEGDGEAEFEDNFDAAGKWKTAPRSWAEPSRQLELEELQQVMMACVNGLPEGQRTLFVLREIDGFDTESLMSTLGISTKNNLFVMMSRARERLRQCMQTNWFA